MNRKGDEIDTTFNEDDDDDLGEGITKLLKLI